MIDEVVDLSSLYLCQELTLVAEPPMHSVLVRAVIPSFGQNVDIGKAFLFELAGQFCIPTRDMKRILRNVVPVV